MCKDGKLECSKIVGETEDGYITEPAEMKRMIEEEKQELFDSEEDDGEEEYGY